MAAPGFTAVHEDYGGVVDTVGGRPVVRRYRRPARTHRAVRNGVGVIELPYDLLEVTGDRRLDAMADALTVPVPGAEGEGRYAFHLREGRIAADCYAYNGDGRVLAFVAPGQGPTLEATLADRPGVEVSSAELTVFGVHGPQATEKVASVLNRTGTPEDRLSFVRGRIADIGVSVIRTDAPVGEPGYEVVSGSAHRERVFDTLLNRGLNAVPFGWETWLALTLEAGTPLYDPDLADRRPEIIDADTAGSTGADPASPAERLTGLSIPAGAGDVEGGTTVRDDGGAPVGSVTRTAETPLFERRLGFAVLRAGAGRLQVETGAGEGTVPTRREPLPFYGGGERSGRCPGRE